MYFIAAIGLSTVIFSLIMAVSPAAWARGILSFSEKPYFHIFEILSRLILGGVLLFFASQTRFPSFFIVVGCIFLFAGILLIAIGESRHRTFAVKSASFTKVFRPAGIAGTAFGVAVIYFAIS